MNGKAASNPVDWDALSELARNLSADLDLPAVTDLAEVLVLRHRELHLHPERTDIPDFRLQVSSLVGARWHDCNDASRDIGGPLDIDFIEYPHENRISRLHARLWYQEGYWRVEDCSSNGTFVNDEKLGRGRSSMLKSGDRICFAHLCFEAEITMPNAVK